MIIDAPQGGLFRSLGKGLGCVLIKSTLGPGENPEGVDVGRGGMHGDNGGQRGTVYEQPGTEVDIPSQLEGAE
jgi:hypothetical protein